MIGSICMLSTHGYFDAVPQLGRTDTGGQVVYVLEVAKALGRRGHRVDIYTRWFDPAKGQIEPVPGAPKVRIVRVRSGPWEFIPKEQIYDVLPELSRNMVELIQTERLQYDLFHGHYVDAGIVTLDVAKALERPAIFTPHSLGAWKRAEMGGDPDELERVFRFSHRISEELRVFKIVEGLLLTTEVQREKLEELYGWQGGNVAVIPPGVDINAFRPLGPDEGREAAEMTPRYILSLSRIDSNKGHDLLLNAFDIVRKEVPGVELVIGWGSPEPRETELEVVASMRRIIEERGMEGTVRIIGYVPDENMVPSYQQAEMFVLPSIFEPFGMTALEAMACGKTVVASRLGGIREVISSGENGLLVDPSDAREFADAMIAVLKGPQRAEQMGREGRRAVEQRFSWDAIAERHVAFYERSIEG